MPKAIRFFRQTIDRSRDRDRIPRSIWWPSVKKSIAVTERERIHDECSTTINRAFLAIVAYALFSLLALGTSDADLIAVAGRDLSVSFSTVKISVKNFLLVGPLILIALTLYMHLFIEEWSKLHQLVPKDKQSARFFNFEGRIARFLTHVVFYWLTPAILCFFYWKSMPLSLSAVVLTMFVLASLAIVLATICRCPDLKRKHWDPPKWIVMAVFAGCVAFILKNGLPSRPLLLSEANLEGVNLTGLNLANADLRGANLKGANASRAILTHADLTQSQTVLSNFSNANMTQAILNNVFGKEVDFSGAQLSESSLINASFEEGKFAEADLSKASSYGVTLTKAHLYLTKLRKAQLVQTNFTDADLHNAFLEGAIVNFSTFTNANLRSASPGNMDLTTAIGLTADQLKTACVGPNAKLPKGLILRPGEGEICPPAEPIMLGIQ